MAEQTNPNAPLGGVEQEVIKEATPIFDVLMKYKHFIGGAVIALIAAAGIYAGVQIWQESTISSAQDELGDILLTSQGEERIARLELFLEDAPDAVRPGGLFELATTNMLMKRFTEAAENWSELSTLDNPEIQTLGKLGRARCLLLGGDAQTALDELRLMRETVPAAFSTPTQRLLAVAAEQSGDKEAALNAYQGLLSGGQLADADYIQYKIARLKAE